MHLLRMISHSNHSPPTPVTPGSGSTRTKPGIKSYVGLEPSLRTKTMPLIGWLHQYLLFRHRITENKACIVFGSILSHTVRTLASNGH